MYFIRVKYYTKDYRMQSSPGRRLYLHDYRDALLLIITRIYNIILIYNTIEYALTEQRNVFTCYYNYLFRSSRLRAP